MSLRLFHALLLFESESRSGKKMASFAKYTSLCNCSSVNFNYSALNWAAGESHWVPWSTKTDFRVAAEVVFFVGGNRQPL